MRLQRTALPLIALAVLAPATASAKPTNPIALAYKAAAAYWQQTPCGGHVKIRVAPEPKWMREEAWKEYHSHDEAFSWAEHAAGPLDPSQWTSCVVTFNREYWSSWSAIDNSYETFCVAMIHELGNELGLPETDEEYETHNVMDYQLYEIVPPTQCTHYALTYPNGHTEQRAWTVR